MNAIQEIAPVRALRVTPVLTPTTFEQLVTFAEMAAVSGLVPKDYVGKPGAIMIAVQMGAELGLSPMQSIQSIAVINGRPGVWGDGLIGLCRGSPLCEDIIETIEGEGDARIATCTAKRRGSSPITHSFSAADAKRAGLWQTEERVRRKGRDGSTYETVNDSPWYRYPNRMLQNRARGFALRDAFPDVLRGLKTVEELMDTPPDTFRGATIVGSRVSDTIESEPVRQAAAPSRTNDAANAAGGAPRRTFAMLIEETRGMLTACTCMDDVVAIADLPQVRHGIEHGAMRVKNEISDMLAEAYGRFMTATHPEAETEAGQAATGQPANTDLDDEIPF